MKRIEIKYEPFRHVWYVEKDGIICYVPEFAVEYIKGVESENAKLRELLCELYEDQCDDGDRWKYRDRMSKFGIEVD